LSCMGHMGQMLLEKRLCGIDSYVHGAREQGLAFFLVPRANE
jgi:hypothetical protein